MDITDRLNELDTKIEEMEESEAEFSQYQKQVNKTTKTTFDKVHSKIDDFIEGQIKEH